MQRRSDVKVDVHNVIHVHSRTSRMYMCVCVCVFCVGVCVEGGCCAQWECARVCVVAHLKIVPIVITIKVQKPPYNSLWKSECKLVIL